MVSSSSRSPPVARCSLLQWKSSTSAKVWWPAWLLLSEDDPKTFLFEMVVIGQDIRNPLATHRRHGYAVHKTIALVDRKSTRLNSSHSQISYAVFCLKKKKKEKKT